MIGRTNCIAGGGGFADNAAILRVAAPTGSTVTLTRGAITKTSTGHPSASESGTSDYYFIIPQTAFSSFPWTVTATYGAKTDTQTVVIETADEYDVLMSYDTFIIRNGVVQTGYTINPMTGNNITAPVITSENGYQNIKLKSNSGVYLNVDYTGFTEMYLDSGIANGSNFNWMYFGFSANNTWANNYWDTSNTEYYHFTQWYPRGILPFDLTQTTRTILKFYSSANSAGFDLQIYNLYMR